MTEYLQWPSKILTQWDDNQRLLCEFQSQKNYEKFSTVIVGSSMAFRMTYKNNPYQDTIYNLSLGGKSAYDGLSFLKTSGHIPKVLLIEINVLYKIKEDNHNASWAFSLNSNLKRNFKGFQYKYRPVTFVQYVYQGIRNKVKFDNKPKKTIVNNYKKDENNVDDKKNLISDNQKQRIILNDTRFYQNTDWFEVNKQISFYVDYFNKKGSKIIFFEMPTEDFKLSSKLNLEISNKLKTNFKDYKFIPALPQGTTDGVHLVPQEAHSFFLKLLPRICNE